MGRSGHGTTVELVLIEHEGLLWKRIDGASSTAEEFLAAWAMFIAIHDEERWNPWIAEDRRGEIEAAMAVMSTWTRAEPGFRQWTKDEIKTQMAQWDADFDRRRQESEQVRKARIPLFDEQRAQARRALLEQQSILRHCVDERLALETMERFPAMDGRQRTAMIDELVGKIGIAEDRIRALEAEVGDPETVVDPYGRLPADRREDALRSFTYWRQTQVRDLREKMPRLHATLKDTKGRAERAAVREEITRATRIYEQLLAMAPLTAEDMCPDCKDPIAGHGWTSRGSSVLREGPCPAWPGWSARMRRARGILMAAAGRVRGEEAQVPAPKPQPLAVIASGLDIDSIHAQLTEIKAKYPGAKVRRGNRNRWEVWPADTPSA